MADELGLKLTAQITEWVGNMDKAAKAADRLLTVVKEVEKGIQAAFAGIEAAARQSMGKSVAAFVASAGQIDKAAQAIEQDATKAGKALDGVGKAAQRSARVIDGAAKDIGRSAKGMGDGAQDAARNLGTGFAGVESQFKAVSDRVSGAVLNIRNAVLGLGALRFGQAAVDSASDFEAALGQLAIVSADTGKPIADLRQQLLDLSKTTPQALGDLTKAYATAVGSLPKGANQAQVAFEALDAAQKAARASGATTEETLRGITALLNTYGDTGLTAAQITDKLFATFDQGAATVPELTASIGQVAGIAKGFGISIDEVFGSIAVLTRGGQTASEAITNLRQALISTANGGSMDKVRDQLEKLGLQADLFSAESLRKNGLIGVLEQVEKAGGKPVLNKLYTDVQGLLAVQTLLAKGLVQTRDDIDRVGDSAGKTDQAVATISQNFDQLAGIAKNRLGAALIDIGERIMPTVARVLSDLANFAEKNGAAIAEGIGKAVEALATLGEWVVQYGPTVLEWFLVFKGVTWFASLAKDIAGATKALSDFSAGMKAAQALGAGLQSVGTARTAPILGKRTIIDADGTSREIEEVIGRSVVQAEKGGEKVGGAFSKGFGGALKGLGSLAKGAISSIPILGAGAIAFDIGYTIGTKIAEAIGDAIERQGQIEIQTSIGELESRARGALARFGARTQEELEEARRRRTAGEVVDTSGEGNIQRFQSLQDIQDTFKGAPPAQVAKVVADAFNAELESRNRQEVAGLGRVATQRADLGAAESNVEELKRRQIGGAELAAAEANLAAVREGLAKAEADLADLQAGTVNLVRQYGQVTAAAQGTAKATTTTTANAKEGAKQVKAVADTFLADLVAEYEAAQAKMSEILLGNARIGAEAAQSEAEARRQAFEAETDARVNALEDADVKESQVAELRAQRERELVTIIDQQILAIQNVARVRAQEAEAAAQKEIEAAQGSAEVQAAIADNLRRQKEQIELDTIDRIEELRRASSDRITAAEREAARDRAAEAIRQQEIAAGVNRGRTAGGRLNAFNAITPESAGGAISNLGASLGGEGAGIGGILGGGALSAIGGTVAVLPAINEGLGKVADFFGGDVEGLLKQARQKDAQAAEIERRLASKSLSDEERDALQERLAGLRAESDELKKAAENAKGGLESFFESLFQNVEQALIGLLVGLPQAVDRILTVMVPKFVEKLIASLPQIIGGLIALLPELVISLTEALVVALPVALYDGFVQAGKAIANAIAEFFTGSSTGEKVGAGLGAAAGGVAGFAFGGPLGAVVGAGIGGYIGNKIGSLFHQGGVVGEHSNPHMAAAIASAGAPRFANGGMVTGVSSLARRRLSQILSGDDVPALLAPGEGVLTARGVEAVGGPTGVESINRGNGPAGGVAQLTISGRVGGDAALAALVSRLVSISISSPQGNVRAAMNRSQLATTIPGWAPLKPA